MGKEVFSLKRKRLFSILFGLPPLLFALLYGGGYISQFVRNYKEWQNAGGTPGNGTSPAMPSFALSDCFEAVFSMPYGIIGILICVGVLALLVVMVMRMGYGDTGEYDKDRNFIYSRKGTYGTSGFMSEKEAEEVLDLTSSVKKHNGAILGTLNGKYVCVPEQSPLNKNMAVYGASGSMKTRAYCINRILQAAAQGESLIICDPKSELYETTSSYLRDEKGYIVRVFNLVSPESSDSWACLSEIEGDELMAQLFCDVIIKNTGSERGDHFWDSAEMNLLKALVLYVEQGYPDGRRTMEEVYKLITHTSEKELNSLFDLLPATHPAKAPFAIFKQASDTVRSGVIIGLGSRLQVFQNKKICEVSVHVQSKAKQLGTWRISNYTPEYRETSGVGRRKLLTMDEVLRLPISQALVIIRGRKILKVDKLDYTHHPEASKLKPCKASAHIPEWSKIQRKEVVPPQPKSPKRTGRSPKPPDAQKTTPGFVPATKDDIMSSGH